MKMNNLIPVALICIFLSIMFFAVCIMYTEPPKLGDVYIDYDKGDTWEAPGESRPYVQIIKVLEIVDDKVRVEEGILWADRTTNYYSSRWKPISFLTIRNAKKIIEGKGK